MDALTRIKRIARRLGGEVRGVSEVEYSLAKGSTFFYESPFSTLKLGVDFDAKAVIFSGEYKVPEIIHELGHILACAQSPVESREFEFFGWEYVLAKKLGVEGKWIRDNSDYTLGTMSELETLTGIEFFSKYPDVTAWFSVGHLRTEDLADLLVERVAFAKKAGIIGPKGQLRSVLRKYPT